MDQSQPLEPDNIRLRPGEHPQVINKIKFRYIAACDDPRCIQEIFFDQMPPVLCDRHRKRYTLDQDYEDAKRITADNPTGKPLPLPASPSKNPPRPFVDITKLGKTSEIAEPLQLEAPPPDPIPDPPTPAPEPSLDDIFGP